MGAYGFRPTWLSDPRSTFIAVFNLFRVPNPLGAVHSAHVHICCYGKLSCTFHLFGEALAEKSVSRSSRIFCKKQIPPAWM